MGYKGINFQTKHSYQLSTVIWIVFADSQKKIVFVFLQCLSFEYTSVSGVQTMSTKEEHIAHRVLIPIMIDNIMLVCDPPVSQDRTRRQLNIG